MSESTKYLQAIIKEETQKTLLESPAVRRVMLENRLALIEEMMALEEGPWLDRARQWFFNKAYGAEQGAKNLGRQALVNPQAIVDDPQRVAKLLNTAMANAKKSIASFKADSLKSSRTINALQEAILDLFGKFFNLLDTIPMNQRGVLEREVMKIVGMYYNALMEEKKRIEVYLSHLAREVGAQGYNLGRSAEAMAAHKAPAAPRVVGSRVVEPEPEMSPELAGARA